ncbi:MAG TPA: hypothetical protein VGL94_10800 [Ktedonobacteraceae bacterium]
MNEKQLLQVEHLLSEKKLQNIGIINTFVQLLQFLHDPCFLKSLFGQQIASANADNKYVSMMSWPSMD